MVVSEEKRDSLGNHLIDTSMSPESFFRNIAQTGNFVDRWIASVNVIYGAILSAYAGISLTKVDVTVFNALFLSMLCFLHTAFLWISSELHHADSNKIRELESYRGVLGDFLTDSLLSDDSRSGRILLFGVVSPGLLLFLAGIAWQDLFGDTLFYAAIVISWYLMIVAVPFWIRSRVELANVELQIRAAKDDSYYPMDVDVPVVSNKSNHE